MSNASKKSADYSIAQTGIAGLTLLGLFATVLFAWRTAKAAATTAKHGQAAVTAANNSAKYSRQANGIISKNAALELRAYISVEPAGINQLIGSDKGIGNVEVRNVGKVPARNVTVICMAGISPTRKFDLSVREDTVIESRVIQPSAAMRQGSEVEIPVAEICKPGSNIFVWGVVFYYDGFTNPNLK